MKNFMGTALQFKKTPFISARLFSSWSHYDHLIPSSVGETASVGERAVAQKSVPEACQYIVKTKDSYEENMLKRRKRLQLWQVFFANPSEWWDRRNSKLTSRSPDFKHKNTNDALWITKNDPPWINEQLELYDSRLSKRIDVHHKSSYEENMQKRRNRLHLWQIFFANPSEWWDNRKSKLTSGCPDFKHKDTNEALWISKNDPPWINKQLQLYDSRMSKWSDVHQKSVWSHLTPLVFD